MKFIGRDHIILHLPIFQSRPFLEFCDSLKAYLSTSVSPIDANIESVLPGIQTKLDAVHSNLGGKLQTLSEKIEHTLNRLEQTVTSSQMQGFINHIGQYRIRPTLSPDTSSIPTHLAEPAEHRQYVLFRGHLSMRSVWNEWNGLGEFSPECNPSCVAGGVKQLETSTKGK